MDILPRVLVQIIRNYAEEVCIVNYVFNRTTRERVLQFNTVFGMRQIDVKTWQVHEIVVIDSIVYVLTTQSNGKHVIHLVDLRACPSRPVLKSCIDFQGKFQHSMATRTSIWLFESLNRIQQSNHVDEYGVSTALYRLDLSVHETNRVGIVQRGSYPFEVCVNDRNQVLSGRRISDTTVRYNLVDQHDRCLISFDQYWLKSFRNPHDVSLQTFYEERFLSNDYVYRVKTIHEGDKRHYDVERIRIVNQESVKCRLPSNDDVPYIPRMLLFGECLMESNTPPSVWIYEIDETNNILVHPLTCMDQLFPSSQILLCQSLVHVDNLTFDYGPYEVYKHGDHRLLASFPRSYIPMRENIEHMCLVSPI